MCPPLDRVEEAHAQHALEGDHAGTPGPMNWVPVSWIKLVAKMAQQKMGMRKRLMPWGRMQQDRGDQVERTENRRKTDE